MNQSELSSHVSELRTRLGEIAGQEAAHGCEEASWMTEDER